MRLKWAWSNWFNKIKNILKFSFFFFFLMSQKLTVDFMVNSLILLCCIPLRWLMLLFFISSWPSPKRSLTGTPNCSPSRLSFHSPGPTTQSCYTQTILCRTLFHSPNWHRKTTSNKMSCPTIWMWCWKYNRMLANILYHHIRSIVWL